MITDLKDEDLINKVGGRFRLSALVQKRMREIMHGARPMVDASGMTPMEIVIAEIRADKLAAKDAEPDRESADAS
jgi:DNA-directed RNA polymerase subunit omega